MLKKLTVLAMAIGAVAALVLPATASAVWKHHATNISNDVQLGLTGNVRFQGGLGGIECQVTSRAKFLAGQTTGTAETFVPHPTSDTTNCKGLGGLAFCQIHNLTPQAPNWTFHTSAWQTHGQQVQHAAAVVITTTTIHSQATGGFCPVNTISLHAGSVGLIPTNTNGVVDPNTVVKLDLNGTLQATLTTTNSTVDTEIVETRGTVEIESPNSHTYSI
jgi:hypothetical protein